MTHEKVKLLKSDNKQLGRKAIRLVQLNCRFCILISLLLVTAALVFHVNKTHRPNQNVRKLFTGQFNSFKSSENDTENDNYYSDEFDLIWSQETVDLFQDQLGIVIDDEVKSLTCQLGEDFVVAALPGADDQNLHDNLWQYLSLISLESNFEMLSGSDGSKHYSLKAFITEQMKVILDQLFEG